jgi:hypothetical protein
VIILPDFNIIVFGPPKCATTTLHYDLTRPPWAGFQLNPKAQHDFNVPGQYQGYKHVSPVRNPYERAMSLYWHYLRDVRRERAIADGKKTPQEWSKVPVPVDEISFTDYMEMAIGGEMQHLERSDYRFFSFTISDWLDSIDYQASPMWHSIPPIHFDVDVTIRVEHLAEDWAALVDRDVDEVKFSTRNAPGRASWAKQRSEQAIELVNVWAHEDFVRYDYEHQTCEGE